MQYYSRTLAQWSSFLRYHVSLETRKVLMALGPVKSEANIHYRTLQVIVCRHYASYINISMFNSRGNFNSET